MTAPKPESNTELIQSLVESIGALEAEIDQLLADADNSFETLPERVDLHQAKLGELFVVLNGAEPNHETLEFLKHSQQKISAWTQQAIEERDETRQTLLKLAQGRKARGQY